MLLSSTAGCAQKETYDVVSYTLPAGWQKAENTNGLQLSVTDSKTGEYAMAVIIKSTGSNATANENFSNNWATLVKGTVSVSDEPTMLEPAKDKDWDIVSGWAHYTDGANKGVVTQITATGYGKVSVLITMTNAEKFQNTLKDLLNSLELTALSASRVQNTPASGAAVGTSIAGLWTSYITETNGTFSNGMPMTTGGYFRHEYVFNADGTYRFLEKDFSAYSKNIFFAYETGTWSINGNELTVTPAQGKNEEWSKNASGRNNEWGGLLKTTGRKLEKITYTVEIEYLSGAKETRLNLLYDKPTNREGRQSNDDSHQNKWHYYSRAIDKSLIDLPPGMKTAFESKSDTPAASQTVVSKQVVSPLAGKIWEGSVSEKFVGAGAMTGYNTGGSFIYQYNFNADGTYRFVYIGTSAYTETNQLGYETSAYSVNGDQLTITPANGANEEWSVVGGPISIAGMSDVQIRNIKEHWGRRLKTEKRKLEKVTYPFSIEYSKGDQANVMILQYNGHTEREGGGNSARYKETAAARSAKLPAGVKYGGTCKATDDRAFISLCESTCGAKIG